VIESCRRRGIDPYAYLKDVLTRLPSMTNRQLVVLLPANWGECIPPPSEPLHKRHTRQTMAPMRGGASGDAYRTSTAPNRGGDVGSIPRPALLAGGLAPWTEVVRIQRFTVSGWTPTFWANSRWFSPESRNSRIS
jgi:hypothetical protein